MDIWQSTNINGRWSQPKPVSFNSDSNDFDPCFSPDGKGVYFFSNRAGGFGGDDIYFAPYNSADNSFSQPVNAGNQINTAGNEWAPVTNAAGTTLVFSSNGRGGFGGQDLFMSPILPGYSFGKAINLGNAVNGAGDDFDAVILPNNAIVFTSAKDTAAKADLYIAYKKEDGYTQAEKLPAQINGTGYWTFGPSVNPKQPGYLYFSGHLRNNMGRTDIYRIKYSVR